MKVQRLSLSGADLMLQGNTGQIPSLPQGGGAIRGIGESFAPDLHTGTGNITLPLALPTGRNGLQPHLSLVYSTGQGNGPFGLGWSLTIPGVRRKTSHGVPRYQDAIDTFLLSGAEDLVAMPGGPAGVTRYRPRTEGLFARIDHDRNLGTDHWEVRTRDGLVSFYGTPGAVGRDPATITDPANGGRVFAWELSRTEDPFGNRVVYEYVGDSGEEGPRHWDQIYLRRIRYVDFPEDGGTRFLVSVTFEYEERPDPFSQYRAGFEIRTRRRCTRIEVRTHAEAELHVRTYELVYLDQRSTLEDLPRNEVSLLSQVRVTGHDGDRLESLPPVEFGYTRFEPQEREFFALEGLDLPARSLASPDLELADLSGNGLPDVLEMNGTVRYWRNLGGGRLDVPRPMPDAPAGLSLAQAGTQLIDANGDGLLDLMVVSPHGLSGYYPLRYGGLWARHSFQRYPAAPSFSLEDPEVRLVDLDGDGVTDAIRSGARLECYFNDPERGWHQTRWVERRGLEEFPDVQFSDPRVRWADMTGDGLEDIVLVYDGNVEYWPNLGHGNWGKRVSMRSSPRFPQGYNPERILVGDMDGDGAADLVYVDREQVLVWINQSGNAWSDPSAVVGGTPPVTNADSVRLADMLGSGVGGVLWSRDAGRMSRESMRFLDLTGGVKPYLLSEMDNHMGAVTRIGYAPSTRFFQEDDARPQTRWKTPLPFPVQVVDRVAVVDAISGSRLTTRYRYHHGYWDGAEREFRGFGMVEQLDTETFAEYNAADLHAEGDFRGVEERERFAPPTLTRTWFHQGPVGDQFGDWDQLSFSAEFWAGDPQMLPHPPEAERLLRSLPRRAKRDALRALRGRMLRQELYALDGTARESRPYTVKEAMHGVREEESPPGPGGEARRRLFFPYEVAARTTQWERGDDPMTQLRFMGEYDEYGQPQHEVQVGCPRGWRGLGDRPGRPFLATCTRTAYARPLDASTYLVDRVAEMLTYALENDGSQRVLDVRDTPLDGPGARLIGQTLQFYDGDAFRGLPFRQVGRYGVLTRREDLVLDEETIQRAYAVPGPAPPYLSSGAPAWTAEFPDQFRALLPGRQPADPDRPGLAITPAGYGYADGAAGSPYRRGYFAATERREYDFQISATGQGQGMLARVRGPLGRDISTIYDRYRLLAVASTDPAGLTTTARQSYRVCQPDLIIDPNGNRTRASYSPLGLVESRMLLGKEGEEVGDTPARPSIRFEYDLTAFMERSRPVSVRAIRRVHHARNPASSEADREETIETVEYSDGFGRLLQTRTQAEDVLFGEPLFGDAGLLADQSLPVEAVAGRVQPARAPPRVVVSGWQSYDNKGQVAEKYEPFFSDGWEYAPATDAQRLQKSTFYRDPRGQVIRTRNPDGSEQLVVYGTPDDLADPEQIRPSPWEAYAYDANDNAGRTHPAGSTGYRRHWNTPTSAVLDALGRTVEMVERNGSDPADWYVTRCTYDLRGNLLAMTDALGRLSFAHVYDLADRPLRVDQIDAGTRRVARDAVGSEIERRDSKGALTLHAYDVLNRPIRLWARDEAGSPVTLRHRVEYGDGGDPGQPAAERHTNRAANRLGRLSQHHDEAGLVSIEAYDFKGNALEKTRRVIHDQRLLDVFEPPPANWQARVFRVDWEPPAGVTLHEHAEGLLDGAAYRSSLAYDALNRVRRALYPADTSGIRRELRPVYNRAGLLERVELDGVVYVERITYNARGQRTLIAYGNGVMTRYAYDAQTCHLARLRTERFLTPDARSYRPVGAALQDFAYQYDLAGNLLVLRDRTPGSGIPSTAAGTNGLDRVFTYEPIHRLQSATGRECDVTPAPPWSGASRCADPTRTRPYTEGYRYDAAGNLRELRHAADGGSFVRDFVLVTGTNRLDTLISGAATHRYAFDANGNLTREDTTRHFEWDYSDRLRAYRTQPQAADAAPGEDRFAEPSVHVQYLYDASGERVKRLARRQGGLYEATVYVDGQFEHHQVVHLSGTRENNTLHVMDDKARIGTLRVGAPFPDDSTPAVQYHLADHLGSSYLVVDDTGTWLNREEFTPYGETSFGGFARKRYRYTGREREEASGLYYHGARFYAPWLCRWISPDPAGAADGPNPYEYALSNPMRLTDPSGLQNELASATEEITTTTTSGQAADFEAVTGVSLSYTPVPLDVTLSLLGLSQFQIYLFMKWSQGDLVSQTVDKVNGSVIPPDVIYQLLLFELTAPWTAASLIAAPIPTMTMMGLTTALQTGVQTGLEAGGVDPTAAAAVAFGIALLAPMAVRAVGSQVHIGGGPSGRGHIGRKNPFNPKGSRRNCVATTSGGLKSMQTGQVNSGPDIQQEFNNLNWQPPIGPERAFRLIEHVTGGRISRTPLVFMKIERPGHYVLLSTSGMDRHVVYGRIRINSRGEITRTIVDFQTGRTPAPRISQHERATSEAAMGVLTRSWGDFGAYRIEVPDLPE